MKAFLFKIRGILFTKKMLYLSVFCWIVFQVIWTTTTKYDLWVGDAGLYQYYATECFRHGTMYPDTSCYYSEYIFNPGWINILVLWLHLFRDFSNVPYFLMMLNILNLFLLLELTRDISKSETIYVAVAYVYMLIPAFSTSSIMLNSELPFMAASLASMVLLTKKWKPCICLAGIMVAIAYWIRPLGAAWFLAGFYLLTFVHKKILYGTIYLCSIAATLSIIAIATHQNFPNYVFSASTGGTNLIMGADDGATGRYYREARIKVWENGKPLFDEGHKRPVQIGFGPEAPCYWEFHKNWSYAEVDSIYKKQSLSWILDHPRKWLMMIPQKGHYMFMDTFRSSYPPSTPKAMQRLGAWLYKWQKYFVRFIFLISLLGLFTPLWKERKVLYIMAPPIIATAMTLATVVEPRYNFIFLPLVILFFTLTCQWGYKKITDLRERVL